ncbi:UNVERIFIED_CONTAM: hypothetical protein Sradi_4151000 [Sesamum radiatum]|uniref:Retrotransposon gag domain-containing protein n=1 Tax=Sesamum radiatum TaxID=300843 RepID=A0AAW2P554_SESRA
MRPPERPHKPWLNLRGNTPSIRAFLHLAEVENYPRLPRRRNRGRQKRIAEFLDPKLLRHKSETPPNRGNHCSISIKGVDDPYLLLAVAPPRRSPFSHMILAEALPTGVKVPNFSEYDGIGDPQEHLDKFYTKIDWYDLSDAAYCKVFCTTLSKHALACFNQLSAGTISSLEQLTQCCLHHFSMNKRVLKTAAFLFTIRQTENETLRDYMQRFVEAVHEVPHVNHELLASVIQQNLLLGRFKESIAGKPLALWKTCSCGHKNTLGLRSQMLQIVLLEARERVGKRKENQKRRRNANTYLQWGSRTTPP